MKKHNIALLALALVFAVGCNRDSGEPAANATTGTTGATGTTGTTPGKKLTIVFIPKSSGNAYFNDIDKGFQDAAKEFGCDYSMKAPASSQATSQIELIKQEVQRGVDVIALSPNSKDALNPVLDEARKKGVTVITVDADLDGNESHRDAAVLPCEVEKVGTGQVELLGSLMGYEGDFAILSATPDAPNQNAWIAQMNKTLADPKYSKMHLVATVYGDDNSQKSATEFSALVSKFPNLRGVLSPTSVGLASGAQELMRLGLYPGGKSAKGKGLVLTGLSTPDQLKKYVTDGVVSTFQLWLPRDCGYVATCMAVQIRSKKLTLSEGAKFDAGTLGSKTVTKNNIVYAGDLKTFDKANIAQFDF